MPVNDNYHVHPGRDCCGITWAPALTWPPAFAETWFGGEYPAARGAERPASGWQCPGCSRCWAPTVRQCGECGPKTELATSTNESCCGPNGCEEAER